MAMPASIIWNPGSGSLHRFSTLCSAEAIGIGFVIAHKFYHLSTVDITIFLAFSVVNQPFSGFCRTSTREDTFGFKLSHNFLYASKR